MEKAKLEESFSSYCPHCNYHVELTDTLHFMFETKLKRKLVKKDLQDIKINCPECKKEFGLNVVVDVK